MKLQTAILQNYSPEMTPDGHDDGDLLLDKVQLILQIKIKDDNTNEFYEKK